MSVRFDRTGAGEGVELQCRLESGKALLTWSFRYENNNPGQGCFLRLCLTDRENRLVLECLQQTGEEEPLHSVLLHPQLWQGMENPYLYKLEAEILSRSGEKVDKCVRNIPLYTLTQVPGKGILLNGEVFCPKTVRYKIPEQTETAVSQSRIMQDMQLMRQLGANSIYVEEAKEPDKSFLQLCERMGFLVWSEGKPLPENRETIPLLRGGEKSLLRPDATPASYYYQYQARWSKSPFVYIVPESIRFQDNGNFTVTVYSSCKRVALYTNGILHAFLSGREEFTFREIAPGGPCLVLTAEAEECAQSLSVHRTFTKSSLFHDN